MNGALILTQVIIMLHLPVEYIFCNTSLSFKNFY